MRLIPFVTGVCFLTFSMIGGVLEDDYARACWLLILGLTNLHIALER